MVLRDICPADACHRAKNRVRGSFPNHAPATLPVKADSIMSRLTRKARLLIWGSTFAAMSLLPTTTLPGQQDSDHDANQSATRRPIVTAPAAKLPASDIRQNQETTVTPSAAAQSGGVYLSIGDAKNKTDEKEAKPGGNVTPGGSATRRASLAGPPASMIQSTHDSGLVRQAPLVGVALETSTQSNLRFAEDSIVAEGSVVAANGAARPAARIGSSAAAQPIVAPVASIQELVFEEGSSPGQNTGESISATASRTAGEKSFVNPTQFRVTPSPAQNESEGSIIVQRLPETNVFGHVTVAPHSTASSAQTPVDVDTPYSDDLDAVVKHVVNEIPTHRLPPVDPIPATSTSSTHDYAMQTSGFVNDAVMNEAVVNAVPELSERRGFHPQDKPQRAPGEPELYSISQLKNPLSHLNYPTNSNDYGDQVPGDESSKRFGAFTEGTLAQDVVRTSISYGNPSTWYTMVETWEAPSFFHRPLYFEEVNLERYGHYVPRWQPAISAAHFAANLASLPYQMYVHPPCEPVYTLGHYRPGSCNPHQIHYLPLGK